MVDLFQPFVDMLWDVAPIALVLFGFQFLILKQKIPHLKQVIIGFVLVWIGLTLFIVGLEK
jgi:steroid 5-alpha reductase family enzyme